MKPEYEFDWGELAFASKKPLRDLNALFIAAPREMSAKRFTQIVKEYLPKGNIVLGVSKEDYVLGLEDQPQFRMLQQEAIKSIVDKVNSSPSQNKIYTLSYSQRDVVFIYEKIKFAKVLLVSGSWYHSFHHRPEYYALARHGMPFEKVSPFADESEAREFAQNTKLNPLPSEGQFTEIEMIELASRAARHSYDFGGLQTGVSLGRKSGAQYELISTAHNEILPYETYSMHHGSIREQNYSPTHDLNFYDTIHAEVVTVVNAQKNKLDLRGAALFINLLPCPTCTRMFMKTDIEEFVYQEDHSTGYAVKMLEAAGKKVRRQVL